MRRQARERRYGTNAANSRRSVTFVLRALLSRQREGTLDYLEK